MLTIAWVNYTNSDKRGPNKRFVEYLVYLNKTANQQNIRLVALFPMVTKDSQIIQTFKENNVSYYFCNISSYAKLFSVNNETRRQAFKLFINNIEEMKAVLKQINCDIVVSNCTLVWEAVFAAKALQIKHILFIRGILKPSDFAPNQLNFKMVRYMEKKLIDLSDYIITQSEFTAKLWGLDHVNTVKREIIPIACEVQEEWQPPDTQRLPIKVLILSGIELSKNQSLVVEMAHKIKQKGCQIFFSIYGNHRDPEYKKIIEQEVTRFGLQNVVTIKDYDAEIDKLFLDHHILLVTSKLESFGTTVIEAMARCRPVISTKCGGPEEIIIHEQTGFLIDDSQIDQFAEVLCDLIVHPEKLTAMGMKGNQRWKEKYTMASVMHQWTKVLLKEGSNMDKKNNSVNIEQTVNEIRENLQIPVLEEKKDALKHWLIISKSPYATSIKVGLINALEELQKNSRLLFQAVGYDKAAELINWADIIIFTRIIDCQMTPVLDEVIKQGKMTLYYVDDSLFNIPEYSRGFSVYGSFEAQSTLKFFCEGVHQVLTCSEWLSRSYIEKYQCSSTWVQPCVKCLDIKPIQRNKDKIIIGFAGNVDYTTLLEKLQDVFLKLYKNYKDKIQFEFFGPRVSFLDQIEAVYYAPAEYTYYEILLARKKWDIGLAYLEDNDFNNNKYFNKYLEYSRFGIAGIYSDIPLYRKIIQDRVNGILVKNTLEDWYNKIEQFIQDAALREYIAKAAYEDVIQNFSVQKGENSFVERLKEYF